MEHYVEAYLAHLAAESAGKATDKHVTMTGAVAIMVKTPGFSPVKTRLARQVGKDAAHLFHQLASQAVASVLQQLCEQCDVKAYFAVAEESAVDHQDWRHLPTLAQGQGGLGERMAHVYQTLLKRHDYVILIGADIPQVNVYELCAACNWLSRFHCDSQVVGPSADGGFWLYGGNIPLPLSAWVDVRYSTVNTGQQFLQGVREFGEVKMLSTCRDVDELEDLPFLLDCLQNSPYLTPEQSAVRQFVAHCLSKLDHKTHA